MKEYLKHAMEFEKYVYIWTNAMNELNSRKRQIYDERRRIEVIRANTINRLNTYDDTNARQRRYKEDEAERYRNKSRNALIITMVLMGILFCAGAVLGIALLNNPDNTFVVPESTVIPILGFTVMIIGSLFTGILPIGLGLFASNKRKAMQAESEAKQLASFDSGRREKMILHSHKSEADEQWEAITYEESVISKYQEEIHNALMSAKSNLAQIYSENVLSQKYRSLVAVAAMYGYLETGRCNTIYGHGGIYDTYEIEQMQLAWLEEAIRTNQTLSGIEDNQRYICEEMRQANCTLSSINSNLTKIEKTNAEIAKNTAISAAANQQTAAATQYLAWRSWANGY